MYWKVGQVEEDGETWILYNYFEIVDSALYKVILVKQLQAKTEQDFLDFYSKNKQL